MAWTVAWTVLALGGATAIGVALERHRSTDLEDPSAGVTAELAHAVPDGAPRLRLRDVAGERGLVMRHAPGARGRTLPEDTGSGLAWGDYDGDGDPDLYVVSFTAPLGAPPLPEGANRLFRNDRGTFVDVTAAAGVADPDGFGMGASFADFDADGDLDLHVANFGVDRFYVQGPGGRFVDRAAELGVADPVWSVAAAWGDLDRDGRLDLYRTSYVDFAVDAADPASATLTGDPNWQGVPYTLNPNAFDPVPNRLYLQAPDGGFVERALESGAADPGGRSLAAAVVDVDADGWLDVVVANDVSPNALLHNRGAELGEALFEEWGPRTGTADPRGSMGISVADLAVAGERADGLPDLFLSHWIAQENALYQAVTLPERGLEYRDRARRLRLGEVSTGSVGWGSAFVDLDLDGRLDLVVANGSTLEDGGSPPALRPQRLHLFWNDGRRFHDLAAAAGPDVAAERVARGLAVADFDLDGVPDLAVSVNRGAPLLLVDETVGEEAASVGGAAAGTGRGSFLAVRLAAPPARRHGAQVEVEGAGGRQVRWAGADASFASGHDAELLYGVGAEPGPLTVRVRWVGGGAREVRGLPAGRRIVVVGR